MLRDGLAGYRDVEVARTAADTFAVAQSAEHLAGLVIVEPLRDAAGVQLAALVRESHPGLPILLAAPLEQLTTTAWRAAARLGALYAPVPLESEDLLPFVTRALIADVGGIRRLRLELEYQAMRAGLSPSEVEILGLAARGHERSTIEHHAGVSPTAYKRRVAGLLAKLGVESLRDAVALVLRRVSGISAEPADERTYRVSVSAGG